MISNRDKELAFEMRANGATYKEIGNALGCSRQNAQYIVSRGPAQLRRLKKTIYPNIALAAQEFDLGKVDIAESLGICVDSLAAKLSGKRQFSKSEIDDLISLLDKPYEFLFGEAET